MLKLKATRLDTGNCRLYCKDQDGNKFVLVNLNTANNPMYWPHDYTASGEPDSPVKDSYDWVLVENRFHDSDFYLGLSNKINSIDDFETLCTDKHNTTLRQDSKYCELLKKTDKVKFQIHYKQAQNLEERCEFMSTHN